MDPRFGNDLISHSAILRRYVVLTSDEAQTSGVTPGCRYPKPSDDDTFMLKFLDEDQLQDPFEDDVVALLREIAIGDKRADPFDWWPTNEKRYPNIAPLARDLLDVQASSVSSEHHFSIAGNMVSAHPTRLTEEYIQSTLLVRAQSKPFESGKPGKTFESTNEGLSDKLDQLQIKN